MGKLASLLHNLAMGRTALPKRKVNTLGLAELNEAIGHSEGLVPNPSGTPQPVPQTLQQADLPGRIRAAGGPA